MNQVVGVNVKMCQLFIPDEISSLRTEYLSPRHYPELMRSITSGNSSATG